MVRTGNKTNKKGKDISGFDDKDWADIMEMAKNAKGADFPIEGRPSQLAKITGFKQGKKTSGVELRK